MLLAAALAVVCGASAQKNDKDHHHKDYSSYLPKKGDVATGVDLVGIVKFVGNSITGNDYGNAVAPFEGDLFAKYFITDNIALRARLGLGVSNYMQRAYIRDDAARRINPQTTAEVMDQKSNRSNSFNLGVGVEFRRGVRRVQGYAGAEAFFGSSSRKYEYKYGNAITEWNYNPSSAFGTTYDGRTLNESDKSLFGGLALFTGVDYFISRSVSLGFEFGLSGTGTRRSPEEYSYERWDTTADAYKKTSKESVPKQTGFSIVPSAGANLMFYF